jgi:hypothetical protein
MDDYGATKRKRGDIRVQLAVSACALLLPALAMGAAVVYLGPSQWPDGGQAGVAKAAAPQAAAPRASAPQASAPQVNVAADKAPLLAQPSDRRPDGDTSFALANAEQRPAPDQPTAAPRAVAQPAVANVQKPANAAPASVAATTAKQAARYADPAPVALANVAPPSDQTAIADPAPSAAKTADPPAADAAVPDAAAATAPSARKTHHETRTASRTKPVHIPLLSEFFQRPAARSR